jgi:hypothetical protein
MLGVAATPKRRKARPEKVEARLCEGFPIGHSCPALIPLDRIWCHGCRGLRQQVLAKGWDQVPQPVGILLAQSDVPFPMCACGGDPSAFHHEQSLLHIEWEWARGNGSAIRK